MYREGAIVVADEDVELPQLAQPARRVAPDEQVSGVTPGEARSDDDYGQYLVIQGAGGMGGRESLTYPERGENGALAIRVYRPIPGAQYRVHVGVGGRSNGPDGDAGAAMIIEIG